MSEPWTIYNNRIPTGLLTPNELSALQASGLTIAYLLEYPERWEIVDFTPAWNNNSIYRAVLAPLTEPICRWDLMPDWVQFMARDEDGEVWVFEKEPHVGPFSWNFGNSTGKGFYITQLTKLYTPGTCDWTDSKIQRPVQS